MSDSYESCTWGTPCLRAKASALALSRAATAVTTAAPVERAGLTKALGAIFAAPRQPIRTGCTPPSCSKERVYGGDEMIAMVLAAAGDPSQLLPAREQM